MHEIWSWTYIMHFTIVYRKNIVKIEKKKNLKILQPSKYPKIAANVRTSEHWGLLHQPLRALSGSSITTKTS